MARPVLRERPYLNLKPPFSEGYPRIGLPPMISWMYLGSSRATSESPPSSDESLFLGFEYSSSQSQSRPSLFAIFLIFLDFWITPSTIASKAPPRMLFVSTRSKSRWDTSTWSVCSPETSTGMWLAANLTSSGVGEYCKFVTSDSYSSTSSTYLSISSSIGLNSSMLIACLILSPKSTARAAAVPPALLIGPAKYTPIYFVPSKFCLILTSEIPSNGAATTPSVRIASAVLRPWSHLCSSFHFAFSPVNSKVPSAISAAISKATDSRSISFSNSLIRCATPSGPTSPSTLSAKSFASGTSVFVSTSKPLDLASLAISYR